MKVTINGNKMTIELDLNSTPAPSSTGKTLLLATSSGKIGQQFNNGDVSVNLNIFIPNPAAKKAA